MKKEIDNYNRQKRELIAGIINEVDKMKTNLVDRIKELPDEDIANLSEFVTPKKAAEILKLSRPTLQKYTEEGLFERYRLGNKIYYRRDDLLQAISKFNDHKNNQL